MGQVVASEDALELVASPVSKVGAHETMGIITPFSSCASSVVAAASSDEDGIDTSDSGPVPCVETTNEHPGAVHCPQMPALVGKVATKALVQKFMLAVC